MKTRRTLSLALAALLLSSLLACAAQPAAPDAVTTPAPDTTLPAVTEAVTEAPALPQDHLGEADFDGAKYIVVGRNAYAKAVTASDMNGEAINDAQYAAARAVEERFHVAVSYEDRGDEGEGSIVDGIVRSGDDTYAVVIGHDGNLISVQMKGELYNLKSMPQFDFSQPWWTKATETLAIGDKAYVASSFFSYFCMYYVRVLVANKTVAADFNLTLPYDKVFAGDWYLDDLIEMCAAATADTNGDGKMNADDNWGLAYVKGNLYTFQNSLGIDVFHKDADNMPYLDFNLDVAQGYLEKMEKLLENSAYNDPAGDYGAHFFSDGRALFCYCNLREVCNIIRDTDLSYGFIPAPKLDENQKEYITSATDAYWCVPISSAARADMIGTITEALSCQHYNLVRPAFYETTMKGKLADAPEDTAVLNMLPATMSIDFGYAYYQVITAMPTLRDLTNTTTSGKLASTYKKLSAALEKQLAATVEKYEKLE